MTIQVLKPSNHCFTAQSKIDPKKSSHMAIAISAIGATGALFAWRLYTQQKKSNKSQISNNFTPKSPTAFSYTNPSQPDPITEEKAKEMSKEVIDQKREPFAQEIPEDMILEALNLIFPIKSTTEDTVNMNHKAETSNDRMSQLELFSSSFPKSLEESSSKSEGLMPQATMDLEESSDSKSDKSDLALEDSQEPRSIPSPSLQMNPKGEFPKTASADLEQ